eukprot:COSAG01_NODE_8555_length_2743_cov_12.852496_1_plen_127_part_00
MWSIRGADRQQQTRRGTEQQAGSTRPTGVQAMQVSPFARSPASILGPQRGAPCQGMHTGSCLLLAPAPGSPPRGAAHYCKRAQARFWFLGCKPSYSIVLRAMRVNDPLAKLQEWSFNTLLFVTRHN